MTTNGVGHMAPSMGNMHMPANVVQPMDNGALPYMQQQQPIHAAVVVQPMSSAQPHDALVRRQSYRKTRSQRNAVLPQPPRTAPDVRRTQLSSFDEVSRRHSA